MQYAIFCYHDEHAVGAWTEAEDEVVMGRLAAVQEPMARAGRLGPVARLQPTTAATTVRDDALVVDGPFAETKEQLLGFYLIDVASFDEAVAFARDLARANPGGAHEIRPISLFRPGSFPT